MRSCAVAGRPRGWMLLSSYCTFSAWASRDFKLLVTFFNSSSRSPDLLSRVRYRESKRRKRSDFEGRKAGWQIEGALQTSERLRLCLPCSQTVGATQFTSDWVRQQRSLLCFAAIKKQIHYKLKNWIYCNSIFFPKPHVQTQTNNCNSNSQYDSTKEL